MLDLKSKLAAAGVVTKEQVEEFDKAEAEARNKKQAQRTNSAEKKQGQGQAQGQSRNKNRSKQHSGKRPQKQDDSGVDVNALKALNRGDAYTRMRKIVEHSRLDDKERTIPGPDDQIFNFVTKAGRVSRLYLKEDTIKSLTSGESAISSFMSHHGLSHCVLPKEVALAFAEVFPLWLRHLQDHPAAGQIEEAEPSEEK